MLRTRRWILLGLAPLLFALGAGSLPDPAESRTLVRRFVEATNTHDYETLDVILAADFTRHSQATPEVSVRSRKEMKAFLRANAATFPDERVTVETLTAEGDRVAFEGTYSGTQAGPMGPFPATGKRVTLDISGVFRIEGGRIAELRILWDNLAALTQLGHWPPVAGDSPSPESVNKAVARAWFEKVINERNLNAIDEHYAPDYVHHGAAGAELRGVRAAREFASAILAASSDRVAVVEQQVAEGNLVVTRFRSSGTHTGRFRGMPPTGNQWVTEGICISRIEDGKIAEDWEIVHVSGL